ncbi:prephenate dehydrogenase/arogenate dehydrogenase family protein [Alloscardovia theropitheci]|uniref:Prephenate dehydrogenase/arogenate dehydrogenase family protein n=1 Tax=Alloscardovia theropitheci TaxID=2496842 RepID=A0A4R0QQN8_9BIFI|nr:prephenate dehydrogenase/arogenate dehydrogenase family protein [Alloscardovia theropitheci]TCD54642.1 prephenate dehydrogenase/arogenate dehydrogenase family protein [Alloscardovia theropitheci]
MRIAIAGLGLIGGSLARILVNSGYDVTAWNHRSQSYEAARKNGIVCVKSLPELAASQPDILVLCTPLKAMDSVLKQLSDKLAPSTTLTDVGSVKREVLATVSRYGLRKQFVGAHPMAGNELAGFDASDVSLFDNATWAITVENDTEFEHFLKVARMVCDGVHNRFVVASADDHDQATAQISHMPHVVATALAAQIVRNPQSNLALALSAGSWRDMTRVALTTPDRTFAMVDENPDNVANLLHDISQQLSDIADLLDKRETERNIYDKGLEQFFESAQPYRDVRAKLKDKVPEGVYSLALSTSSHEWANQLVQASRKGGRIEFIDSVEAIVRHFPHLRDE